MQAAEALKIIEALADGVDPNTGEVLPEGSPYQHPQIVRALHTAAAALQKRVDAERRSRRLPGNAGKAWNDAEDKQLTQGFETGTDIAQLAKQHKRTRGAIQSRLERLGKIPASGRFPAR
jgi:hypothetical protein